MNEININICNLVALHKVKCGRKKINESVSFFFFFIFATKESLVNEVKK